MNDYPRGKGPLEFEFDDDSGPTLELDDPPVRAHSPAPDQNTSASEVTPPAARRGSRLSVPGESSADRASEARGLFLALEKATKSLNLYEGKGEICEAAIDQAYFRLSQVVAEGELLLRISPYELLLDEESVYSSQEERTGLSYGLFRDGLRELSFLPEVAKWEFRALLEIMRASPRDDKDEDSVTRLWNLGLKGIHYWAIDVAQDGMFDVDRGGLQEQVNELIEVANRPLDATETFQSVKLLQEMLDITVMDRALGWWRGRVTDLRGQKGEAPIAAYKAQLASFTEDTWKRSINIVSVLIQDQDEGTDTSTLIVQILERLWDGGQWSELAAVCQTIAEIRRQKTEAGAHAGQVLIKALNQLCSESRILALYGVFETGDAAQLSFIMEVVSILPATVDPLLVKLLLRTPAGTRQTQLLEVITARGADLTDFYARQLQGQELKVCLSAVKALRAAAHPRAIQALRNNIRHPHPRVQVEVLAALEGQLGDDAVPGIVACLSSSNVEVQEQCLKILELIQVNQHKALLLPWVKNNDFERWPTPRRQRLLRLLIRWGGPENDEYVLGRVTVSNPLRRRKVEEHRQEMLQAINGVGGTRAQKLLLICLEQRRSPSAVVPSIKTALELLDKEK